jgi:hypothetical protein
MQDLGHFIGSKPEKETKKEKLHTMCEANTYSFT